MASDRYVLGVDVGGTKIAMGVVSSDGQVAANCSEPIEKGDKYGPVYQIARMARQLICRTSDQVGAMGIAVPAVVDRKRKTVIWAPNIPDWENIPLGPLLEEELKLPVFLDFDGHISVLGEQWVGAGEGKDNVVFLIVGTGIGAGLWLNGRLYRGASGIAGGVGWYVMNLDDVRAGRRTSKGFFEEIAAGPGIASAARQAVENGPSSLLTRLAPAGRITARTVFDGYEQGDELSRRIVEQAVLALGMGVSNLVSTLNPDIVIVGGGVGTRIGQLGLLRRVQEVVREYAQPQAGKMATIVPPRLGNLVGVVGAARLAWLELAGGS